jgi:hypothetical protein
MKYFNPRAVSGSRRSQLQPFSRISCKTFPRNLIFNHNAGVDPASASDTVAERFDPSDIILRSLPET